VTSTTLKRAAAARRRRAASRRHLLAGSSREVLARIVDGDPLGLRERVGSGLLARHLLLDPDEVHLRAIAAVAAEAGGLRVAAELGAWLQARVDEAIDESVEELCAARSPHELRRGAWNDLATPLGLPSAAARAACARFNILPATERELFFRAVLERRSLDDLARASGLSLTELARRARRVLDTILGAGAASRGASASSQTTTTRGTTTMGRTT